MKKLTVAAMIVLYMIFQKQFIEGIATSGGKLFPVYMLIWLMVGFSLTAYADSWFMWKLFRPYFAQDDGEEFVKDTEPDQYVF